MGHPVSAELEEPRKRGNSAMRRSSEEVVARVLSDVVGVEVGIEQIVQTSIAGVGELILLSCSNP